MDLHSFTCNFCVLRYPYNLKVSCEHARCQRLDGTPVAVFWYLTLDCSDGALRCPIASNLGPEVVSLFLMASSRDGPDSSGLNNCEAGCCPQPGRMVLLGIAGVPYLLEKLKNRQVECTSDDLKRIECWVGLTPFKATEVRLIKAATLTKNNLAHTALNTELAHCCSHS
jgi:hypothetical protein